VIQKKPVENVKKNKKIKKTEEFLFLF